MNLKDYSLHPGQWFAAPQKKTEVASIICHSNCRLDKTDLYLEEWVWQKLRDSGFTLINREGKAC